MSIHTHSHSSSLPLGRERPVKTAKDYRAMAEGGERDARWLADGALLYLSQQKLTRKPPEAV